MTKGAWLAWGAVLTVLTAGCAAPHAMPAPSLAGAEVRPRATGSPAAPAIVVATLRLGKPVLEAFSRSANGNVAPLRTVSVKGTGLGTFSPLDTSGTFWAVVLGGASPAFTHFSSQLRVLGSIAKANLEAGTVDAAGNAYIAIRQSSGDQVFEYSAGSYGSHVLRMLWADDVSFDAAPHLAIDASENLFVSAEFTGNAYEIAQYGPRQSGWPPPKRTFAQTPGYASEMGVDAAGNVYVLYAAGAPNYSVWQYTPSSAVPNQLLPGTQLSDFAVDAGGTIYAVVPAAKHTSAIEVFPPGAIFPTARIAGSRTGLTTTLGIAVSP